LVDLLVLSFTLYILSQAATISSARFIKIAVSLYECPDIGQQSIAYKYLNKHILKLQRRIIYIK
jgi:hypothetical protein